MYVPLPTLNTDSNKLFFSVAVSLNVSDIFSPTPILLVVHLAVTLAAAPFGIVNVIVLSEPLIKYAVV